MKKPSVFSREALAPFTGLSSALSGLEHVHSYTMDLGFALGLLALCRGKTLLFSIDANGYRPVRLSKSEWKNISRSHRFSMQPKFCKTGVFHSKAWMLRNGLLLGSANLSVREARDNLNFWCWMPGEGWQATSRFITKNESGTIIIDLSHLDRKIIKLTLLAALSHALKGKRITSLLVVSSERPSRKLLFKLSPYMSDTGRSCFFLRSGNAAIDAIPGRSKWEVHNFTPSDKSIGLHGKAVYAEWHKGTRYGAVLYVGSANFTMQGYSGRNMESGILITGVGRSVIQMQRAVESLLGRIGVPCRSGTAWATERFDGRWERIKPCGEDVGEPESRYLSKDDIDFAVFITKLEANHNQLTFPAKYGAKKLVQAELSGYGGYPQIWMIHQARRIFSHVFWSPALLLKITLQHGRTISINVPPLDGLMCKENHNSELLELLFDEPEPLEGKHEQGSPDGIPDSAASIYAGQRVLFPWRAILSSKQGGHHLLSKRKLDRAIHSIKASLSLSFGNTEDARLLQRKLEVLASTLTKLRHSI